jgi:hypothetical protein
MSNTIPRSPFATAESVLAAEYEEWPLHGFLKCTRIGSITRFNLRFHLTHIPEHLELSGLSEALRSSIETSAQHQTSHSAVAHSKTRHVELRHLTKRIPWIKEEDETLVKYTTLRSLVVVPDRENAHSDKGLSIEIILLL